MPQHPPFLFLFGRHPIAGISPLMRGKKQGKSTIGYTSATISLKLQRKITHLIIQRLYHHTALLAQQTSAPPRQRWHEARPSQPQPLSATRPRGFQYRFGILTQQTDNFSLIRTVKRTAAQSPPHSRPSTESRPVRKDNSSTACLRPDRPRQQRNSVLSGKVSASHPPCRRRLTNKGLHPQGRTLSYPAQSSRDTHRTRGHKAPSGIPIIRAASSTEATHTASPSSAHQAGSTDKSSAITRAERGGMKCGSKQASAKSFSGLKICKVIGTKL